MKYRDLIEFDPIERVIKLIDAGEIEKAKHLVETYVISDQMAGRLVDEIVPQLRFDQPSDNQGLMVVGDYGTGKSHLMSVLAAITEFESTVPHLNHDAVEGAAGKIAGDFQVHRIEIGNTKMSLRDIIVRELEDFLGELGVAYEFPAQDDLVNHQPAFEDMMSRFQEAHPEQGLLLVVDEMLDYLAGRKEQQIINDLGFLREVGEACKTLRFRFIAGLQESLFESPRFQFVADRLQRVKDRFEQVRIVRGDVKHVVQERLLKKTADQQVKVREHLDDFAEAFGGMTGRMEEFVKLFPVHPDYIDAFEELTLKEKRGILKTLTREMNDRIDDEVPDDDPGLIAYDSFWPRVEDDASLRSEPDIREVLEAVEVLKRQVKSGLQETYQDLAVRLIQGLAVQRLTVSDVYTPIGITAKKLRDQLCLYDPMVVEMGGDPEGDMESQVKMVLQKIIKAVNGQFIEHNEENGQYYLDLEKTQDYGAIIANKADTLGDAQLDQYYSQILLYALEIRDDPHVTGHKIYTRNVLWHDRNVERPGYLLFGTPNERSTAAPPLEFYVYFPQPFDPPSFEDAEREDEVFFRLDEQDDVFLDALRRYSAAMELWSRESGTAKRVYEEKAEEARKELIAWIQENLRTAFTVTHAGVTKTLAESAESIDNLRERIGLGPNETASVSDFIDAIAGACLEGHFESIAPEYPSFETRISRKNLDQAAQRALLQIDQTETKQGASVLDGLELRKGEKLRPRSSRYAQHILDLLDKKDGNQVVNHDEIYAEANDSIFMAPDRFRLEPEWTAVVLTALVANGDLILALPGEKYDATKLRALVRMDPGDVADFRYVEPPKEWPLASIKALLELLDMVPGKAQAMAQGDSSPIGEMQEKINAAVNKAAELDQALDEGMSAWDTGLLTQDERQKYKDRIQELKTFLERMQNYNTLGKLKNFHASVDEVDDQQEGMDALQHIDAVKKLQTALSPFAGYLSKAETVLPESNRLGKRLREKRGEFGNEVTKPDTRSDPAFRTQMRNELQELKDEYITEYIELHQRDRLGPEEDERKGHLVHHDNRFKLLQELSEVHILPTGQLEDFKGDLLDLESCTDLTTDKLETSPTCPDCGYEPPESRTAPAAQKLQALDDRLDELTDEWTASLVNELNSEDVQEDIRLLDDDQQAVIEDFLDKENLEYPLPDEFVGSVNRVLEGLTAVTVDRAEVYDALRDGGAPASVQALRERFEAFVEEKMDGREDDEVRFVLE